MKKLLIVAALFTCLAAPAQGLLHWDLQPVAVPESLYVVQLSAKLPAGWVLYADNPSAGITGPVLVTDPATAGGERLLTAAASFRNDPLFGAVTRVYTDSVCFTESFVLAPGSIYRFEIECFLSDGERFLPDKQVVTLPVPGRAAREEGLRIPGLNVQEPLSSCGEQPPAAGRSLAALFLLGVAGGLVALLTPCVFPMVPVTVSFFVQRSSTKTAARRNGLLYGGSIFLIYLLVSLPFHLAGQVRPSLFNEIATNAWVNLGFFVLFIVFGLSFFGLFTVALPSRLVNSAGRRGAGRTVAGIFFMALSLVIVSFSCTGPLLGSLLVSTLSSTQGAWPLTAGLAGFGAALGLPFGLFAQSPRLLHRIPRSGEWLNDMKQCLAFFELALALKFLSQADLILNLGLLRREVFIGVWLLLSLCMGLFFLRQGYSKEGVPASLRRFRTCVAVAGFAVAFYLLPGLSPLPSANLSFLSGLAPPLSYSIYGKDNLADKVPRPAVVNDYAQAVALARRSHKKVLLDFTGRACVNCRKMEEQVWTDPKVKGCIEENFILVSLYVDDRSPIPAIEADGKLLRTAGERWAYFQSVNFGQVTQPLYAILDSTERLVNPPIGYTPDAGDYLQWLQCGLEPGFR